MSMFTFSIFCLITFNLPWFMDLTFLWNIVLYSIALYFHQGTHPQLSIISLWLSCFILYGAISNCSLFFPSSILDTFQSGGLMFWFHSFCLIILFMEFLWQEHWSGLPFPPPVDHVLSELYKAFLIDLLSYTSPFIMTMLWSMSMYEYHLLYPCHWANSRG